MATEGQPLQNRNNYNKTKKKKDAAELFIVYSC